jgi:glycosyltransferase involved in cell wall biosynthesis
MDVAVIISTYNRPDALAVVLEGYLAQTDKDFEVVIADDGSTNETHTVVGSYQARAPFRLIHVWQEDRGFRAAAIRNRALAATWAEYVIFSDGDCIPVANFVACHRQLAERGWFIAGNRVLLSESFTEQALREKLALHAWRPVEWIAAWTRRDVNRWLPLLTLPDFSVVRKLHPGSWEGAKTCNLAAWRADLLRVNGLDEAYSGWGLEDSDLVIRLLHAGVKRKSARFAAPVLHLWHPENDRSHFAENRRRLEEVLRSDRVAALAGVKQYL